MIDLKYSLVIEATEDPTFFGFYSPDLEGFTGIGHSIEDCLYQAKWGYGLYDKHVGFYFRIGTHSLGTARGLKILVPGDRLGKCWSPLMFP